MSGLDFQSRVEERIAPSSLSSYMEKMEEERESARPGGTSLRKKRSGAKVKKSVTFQDEVRHRDQQRYLAFSNPRASSLRLACFPHPNEHATERIPIPPRLCRLIRGR